MRTTTEALVEDILGNPEEHDVQALLEALAIAKDLGIYCHPAIEWAKEAQTHA